MELNTSHCYLSLSSKSISDDRTCACLKSVGRPNRLLLETDSPYLDKNPYLLYKNGEKKLAAFFQNRYFQMKVDSYLNKKII